MLVFGSSCREFFPGNEFLQAIHELFELSVANQQLINLYAKIGAFPAGLLMRQHIIVVLHVMSPRADHNIEFAWVERSIIDYL
jgi:hypothetical protein